MSDEFADPRDHGCNGDDGSGGADVSGWTAEWNAAYVETLMLLADEAVAEVAIELAVRLDGRWPELRILWQDEVFYLPDRTELVLAEICADLARDLVEAKLETVDCHYYAAVLKKDDLGRPPGGRLARGGYAVQPNPAQAYSVQRRPRTHAHPSKITRTSPENSGEQSGA